MAYNFFIDRYGQTFEGRYGGIRKAVISAATSGINNVSTSVAVLGDFTTAPVPQEAYNSLIRLLAFKLAYHGVNPQGSSSITIGSNTSSKWAEGSVWKDEMFREKLNKSYPGYVEMFDASAPAPRSSSRRSRCSSTSPPNGRRRCRRWWPRKCRSTKGLDKLAESINGQLKEAGLG